MKTLTLSDREVDTLASICEMYAENNANGKVFRGRKGYKFKAEEFSALERKLRGEGI